jgi:lipopolysaccharide export LptBFGC system permease protein LptF
MTSTEPQLTSSKPSTKLLVASTLAWFAGILNLLVVVAVGIPQVALHGRLALLFVVDAVLAVGLCVAGYLLRKRRRTGGVLAVSITALFTVINVVVARALSVGAVMMVATLVLVLLAWKELE